MTFSLKNSDDLRAREPEKIGTTSSTPHRALVKTVLHIKIHSQKYSTPLCNNLAVSKFPADNPVLVTACPLLDIMTGPPEAIRLQKRKHRCKGIVLS